MKNIINHLIALILIHLDISLAVAGNYTRPIVHPMAIGLDGVSSYGETCQFADMMKHSREWRARKDEKSWTVIEDEHGWPVSLKNNDGSSAEIDASHPIFMYFYGHRVQGPVTLTWEGDGEVSVGGRGYTLQEDKFPAEQHRVYLWDYKSDPPTINVLRSNPKNHVKNIRLWMPGMEKGNQTFNPEWKANLQPFPYLRFMDWCAVNGSKIAEWNERTKPDDMRQSEKGVAWEYIIQLANETGKDAWICIPHLATDDYVRQLSRLIKSTLKPDLRIYVEYSNEIWNPAFSQTQWLYKQAKNEIDTKKLTGRDGKPLLEWEYASNLCGRRSAQIWKIMAEEIGDPDRIIRTITHFRWIENAVAAALDPANGEGRVDLIATNGYFISHNAFGYCQRSIANWNLDEAFDLFGQLILLDDGPAWKESIGKMHEQWPSIPVTCYEGGQHFANPFAANSQGDGIAKLMFEVNSDPRIKDIYRSALESWHLAGGNGFTAFVDCGTWSKYGCWGHKQYPNQPLENKLDEQGKIIEQGAYKYAALLDYIKRSARRNPAHEPVIETIELPEAVPGEPYKAVLKAHGGSEPYVWSIMGGRLPGGLTLKPDGTITGIPKISEQLVFMVDCTDSKGVPVAKTLGLFMPPVAPDKWINLTSDQLTPIHSGRDGHPMDFPGLSESAKVTNGYAVQATFTHKTTPNQYLLTGFAIHLNPEGDKEDYIRIGIRGGGENLIVCSRYLANSQGELWGERKFAIVPDVGEDNSKTAWDPGEAWTLTATVRPAKGPGAVDIVVEIRDEQGHPRLVGDRADVSNGRALLREIVVKKELLSGPWGLMLNDSQASNIRWAHLP